jgi:hypothetical protein
MGTNNELFNIIKSMSMNEKRAFKIFCKKHILGDQNKYILLFDTIDNCIEFDEVLVKQNLKVKGYTHKYFSSDKNYLTKTILRSLNEFHSEKTCDLKIKQNLISIEILFYKGLYKECLSLIKKTKRIKLASESPYLILETIKWEKKCIGYSKGLIEAIETNNLLDNYFDNIKSEKIITDFYYKSYYYKNSIGKTPKKELEANFNEIFKSEIFKNKDEARNIHSNIFFYLIYANYYHVTKDVSNELIYLRKVIVFFDNNEVYKLEKPLDYISIYIRIINLNKQLKDSTFYEDLKTLRSFDKFINIQDKVSKERIFLFTYQAEIEYLLNFNELEKGIEIMNEMQLKLKMYEYIIEPYYIMSIYYLFASIYCSIGNFSSGLKYVNTILNEYNFNQRPKTFIKTEFLNIVIHYELKNYDLVQKNITSLKKKYKSNFKLSFLEKNILKTISKIISNPNIIHERVAFFKLKSEIEKKSQGSTLIEKNYMNYIISKSSIN